MSVEVLTRLTSELAEADAEAAQEFRDLVVRVANADETDSAADVRRILRDAGKTADDLSDAVTRRQRRIELADQLQQARATEAERSVIQEKIKMANADLEAAQQRYEATVAPLQLQLSQCNDASMRASALERELSKSCTDPEILSRLTANSAKQSRLHSERKQLADERAQKQANVQRNEQNIAKGFDKRSDRQPHLDNMTQQIAAATERIATIDAELVSLVTEQNELNELKLLP